LNSLLRVAFPVCDARRTVSTAALLDRNCCRSRRLFNAPDTLTMIA
jgi:hypothetical protein